MYRMWTTPQVVQALASGGKGLRGAASKLGNRLMRGLKAIPGAKSGSKMSSHDLPRARCVRDTQAILSSEIDWNAPELQTLSPSARDFLERLLQVRV